MKKILSIIAIVAVFAACKSNTKTTEDTKVLSAVDTAGLHDFQVFKEQQRIIEQQKMFETQGINDGTNSYTSNVAPVAAQPVVRERIVYVSRPAPATTKRTATRSTSTHRSSGGGYSGSNGGYAGSSGTVAQAPARKKGWSKAAKGAVIGGGSGAVLGAIISKNKVKGAVIGGVLGAAGGYVFGRSKDKQDGRY